MDKIFKLVEDSEKQKLVGQLKNIWKLCFSDTDEGTDFVFENIYPKSRCYCCFSGFECCAALYLIDGLVPGEDKKLYKGHYLFGAGTLPQYRGLGIMSQLIEYSLMDSAKTGDKVSVLLPANKGLYDYYGRLMYQPLYGTSVREYSIPAEIQTDKNDGSVQIDKALIRENTSEAAEAFNKTNRSIDIPVNAVVFPDGAVENALRYNSIYGGFTVLGKDFSVVASSPFEEKIIIYQMYGGEKRLSEALNWIGKEFGCKKAVVRLPMESSTPFGMMRVLDKKLGFSDKLYIGLTKD